MGYSDETAKGQELQKPSFNLRDSAIPRLIQELSNSLANVKNTNISKLQTLNSELLKALPPDINSLPKETNI